VYICGVDLNRLNIIYYDFVNLKMGIDIK
jgi:hypothetical protein